jgi:hypothetical protein
MIINETMIEMIEMIEIIKMKFKNILNIKTILTTNFQIFIFRFKKFIK